MATTQPKTPSYTKRAIDNYRKDKDFINLTIKKGEKDLWKSVGLDNKAIIEVIRAEFERRNAEIKPENDKSGKPASEMTDGEKLDFFNV